MLKRNEANIIHLTQNSNVAALAKVSWNENSKTATMNDKCYPTHTPTTTTTTRNQRRCLYFWPHTVVPWLTSIIMAAQGGCDRLGGLYEKDRTFLNATD